MKQNHSIHSILMALFSLLVIPIQAKQSDAFTHHASNVKGEISSKPETRKDFSTVYQGKHPQHNRHHRKCHGPHQKNPQSVKNNGRLRHHQHEGIHGNSNPGRFDSFRRNQSDNQSRDFHSNIYSKHGRKIGIDRHHHEKVDKSRSEYRNRGRDRNNHRD